MKNVWYSLNKPLVDKVLYKLKELALKGSVAHELNTEAIVTIINSLINENFKLGVNLERVESQLIEQKKILDEILKVGESKGNG